MTTIHVQLIGDQALLERGELDRLVALARQCEQIELQVRDDELTTHDLMRLAENGGAFDFWRDEGEDVYTAQDGEPV